MSKRKIKRPQIWKSQKHEIKRPRKILWFYSTKYVLNMCAVNYMVKTEGHIAKGDVQWWSSNWDLIIVNNIFFI